MNTGGEVEEARLQPQGRHNTKLLPRHWRFETKAGENKAPLWATFFGKDLTEGFIIQHCQHDSHD